MKLVFSFLVGISLFFPICSDAQENVSHEEKVSPTPSNLIINPSSSVIDRMAFPSPSPVSYNRNSEGYYSIVLYFFLLLGVVVAGMYFFRNGFAIFQPKNKSGRKLTITETRMLGNRQFLVVAEYEGKKMLLGVCPGRIDYLSLLETKEAPEAFSTTLQQQEEKQ